MALSLGIVGLPNVGKSTLFNALTKQSVDAENYPFCTIDPSVGLVPVPDERLTKLSEMSRSAETIPAVVEFVDIAGLVAGAAEGQGLGNKFLSHIREVDAIVQVVRIFEGEDVHHVSGGIDPLRDIGVINLELSLADQETVSKRRANVEREVRSGSKEAKAEAAVLDKVMPVLEEGKLASETNLSEEEKDAIKHLHLLTMKKMLYVLNKRSGGTNLDDINDERWQALLDYFESSRSRYLLVDAHIEADMKDMDESEKGEFRGEYGDTVGLSGLIMEGYILLGLISFFTTGEKETRAWTTHKGASGPEAGASIHTDFKEKFIRAQVIAYDDLIEAGSYPAARSKGLVRTEGKEYIVRDGDVIEFLI